jgi:uncharacterized protein YggT (Ycf19 family)
MFLLREILSIVVSAINVYSMLLTVWIVIRMLIYFGVISHYTRNNVLSSGMKFLDSIIEPPLEKIRNNIPVVFGRLDLSPVFLYLTISLVRSLLFYIMY